MSATQTQNKKLLIISYYWPPAGGPGVQRWLKFAKYLPEFGFDPLILTVDENQASYALKDTSLSEEVPAEIKVFRTSTRELYSLYLKLTGRENIPFSGFVQESRPSFKENVIRFLRTQFFIPDPRKGWNKFAYRKACELIADEKIHGFVTTGPPHSSHLIGLRLKKKHPSLFWVSDFRDPWTHIFFFEELKHTFISRRIHNKLEEKVLQASNKVVVVGNSMKTDFITDHGAAIDPSKICVITNGYDEEDFAINVPLPDKEFTITYTGTLAENYRIDAFIDAVAEINSTSSSKIKLRFIGEICDEYQKILHQKLDIQSIEIIPTVSHQQAIEYLFRSKMLLLVIPDAPDNKNILTGKLFEYLASQKPIIGVGPIHGDAANILEDSDAGCMFDYSAKSSMKEYLLELGQNLKGEQKQANNDLILNYSRKMLTQKLAELFK